MYCVDKPNLNYCTLTSVVDPDFDLVGSEPFWSDPDPINCPEPNPTIKRHKTRKKSKKLSINVPNLFHFYKIEIKKLTI